MAVACAVGAMGLASAAAPAPRQAPRPGSARDVVEASIAELQRAMTEGRTTSRQITRQYQDRIRQYDPQLRAVMILNPRALEDADARDRERARGRVRGPLHGIPIALKDNIQTTSMRTTGGALAFSSLVPPYEATIVTNLRAAGAVVIAKTSLTELANWVAEEMPNHFNPVAGQGGNPYDPVADTRLGAGGRGTLDPGGSSSGSGTAASLWAASVGTETSGSILTPADRTMLVGIKPTVGRLSRRGLIPITADQDTPGPMARSVADAALLLGAMEGVRPDPADPATTRCAPPPGRDYTRGLDPGRLRGARIGVPRRGFTQRLDPGRAAAFEEALELLQAHGATVVDPADLPSTAPDAAENLLAWPICAGADEGKGHDAACSVVLKYGMKRDFGRWLTTLGRRAPVPTLAALRRWNGTEEARGAIRYGQARLDISDEMDLVADRARYEADRARDLRMARTQGIDAVMAAQHLDALLFAGAAGADVAARAGYPSVIVPFGFVVVRRAGLTGDEAPLRTPFGVTFTGGACSEPALIGLAYAFEQATRRRVAPAAFP